MGMGLFFLLLFQQLILAEVVASLGVGGDPQVEQKHDECMPKRCAEYYVFARSHRPKYISMSPEVRFPFWLKDHQPEKCGYGPQFALSCFPSDQNLILVLPLLSVNLLVYHIDYDSQVVILFNRLDFVPYTAIRLPPNRNYLNLSTVDVSPTFRLTYIPPEYPSDDEFPCTSTGSNYYLSCFLPRLPEDNQPFAPANISLFSCPFSSSSILGNPISWLSTPGEYVYVAYSDSLLESPILSCTKMFNVPSIFPRLDWPPDDRLSLSWNAPDCRNCGSQGRYCRLIKNASSNINDPGSTECFDEPSINTTANPPPPPPPHAASISWTKIITGAIFGPFILLVVVVAICCYISYISKKEDQVKIERFLEDYRALKPTRYTYAEIKRITDNFKDKLGQGGYGTVYKGKLSNDVYVAAKILNNFSGNGDDFTNEVGTIGTIHHVNVVRLVGYCADGYKKALVYEFMPNDSLQQFLSSDQKKQSLGWEKLLDIALGIAKGIEYLHQGCDHRILHFDIKPHNVLLDKNFNPKISDFGLAKLCSKEQSVVSMTAARGTVGYIAPEVFSRNFGKVSHKSDVYSFGMLLIEMVGEKKNNTDLNSEGNRDEVYFPEWIYKRLSREEENTNEIDRDEDAKIVKKLTIVGLRCIQWYPADRPSMNVVVQMLEGDGETLVVPSNPFSTTNASTTRGSMGGRPFSSILEIISESD